MASAPVVVRGGIPKALGPSSAHAAHRSCRCPDLVGSAVRTDVEDDYADGQQRPKDGDDYRCCNEDNAAEVAASAREAGDRADDAREPEERQEAFNPVEGKHQTAFRLLSSRAIPLRTVSDAITIPMWRPRAMSDQVARWTTSDHAAFRAIVPMSGRRLGAARRVERLANECGDFWTHSSVTVADYGQGTLVRCWHLEMVEVRHRQLGI